MILTRAVGGPRRIPRPVVPWAALPAAWAVALGALAWWLPDGGDLLPGLAVTPVLALADRARRLRALAGGVLAGGAVALAVLGAELAGEVPSGAGPALGCAATVLAAVGAGMWAAARRSGLSAELDRAREIATAAQEVLLRPLPRRTGPWSVASAYASASRGALIGGDFYEVLVTPYGVRALIGDARGHGLPAIGMVAALLGSFREAAHQEPDQAGVLRRLDEALRRHLRERAHEEHPAVTGSAPRDPVAEEFATVQLVQLGGDGAFQVISCGHPEPYLLGQSVRPLPLGDPLPPLGLFETARTVLPVRAGRIAPGEGLLLHTDGLQDARDGSGRFFPLRDALYEATGDGTLSGPGLADHLGTAVRQHAGGRLRDDMALLVLVRDGARARSRDLPPRTAVLSAAPRT
ncbi:PP2C family protein-serine/threonine phosphatase [Streptomyces sp. HPF1205]|uniref:PP2C family protein-serine/threonine phosphatase n=1 Tax=Streptomyces sp. HPF1205 TaxID=2873262 RepID=UPI001CEC9405|nr:PP2C family protein-serine/threonine phosphatase [Streptomyces sp. HPF1205]